MLGIYFFTYYKMYALLLKVKLNASDNIFVLIGKTLGIT